MPEKPMPFANTAAFYAALGCLYAAWSRAELAIDCAVWKALGTETAEQAHQRSAGMRFSDKCKQFRTLLDGGNIPNGEKVKEPTDRHRELRPERLRTFIFGVGRTRGDVHPSKDGARKLSSDRIHHPSRQLL